MPNANQVNVWVDELLQEMPAGQVIAPQLGLGGLLPKKAPIPKVMVNPELPTLEFNVQAKKQITWYRPKSRIDLIIALQEGHVVMDQLHPDEVDVTGTWSPIKYPDPKKITVSRLNMLQIHPDKQYMVCRSVITKNPFTDNMYAHVITKSSYAAIEAMEKAWKEQNRPYEWLGAPFFHVVKKGIAYV